jgi:hypothetical protein
MAAQRAAGVLANFPDLVVGLGDPDNRPTKCLILGDPGEADGSQFAVIDPMFSVDAEFGSDFMVILSDVIYPAGNVNDYVNAFYNAYGCYRKPILGLPGNHDWYDGLNGFMFHFCGAEPLPPTAYRRSSFTPAERIARLLWRQADRPKRAELRAKRYERDPAWTPPQPGPYWALDMKGVRLVAIDTGIKGRIDREQAEWLLRVSAGDQPKVLLTGKPLWADGEPKKTPIDWGTEDRPMHCIEHVDDVVRHEDFHYVASIGGDIHNYQRLTVRVAGRDRPLEYVVAGGSGAYLSATHRIGRIDARVQDFRCYPTRGDSLAYYSRRFGRFLVRGRLIAAAVLVLALAAGVALPEPRDGGSTFAVMAASVGGLAAIIVVIILVVLGARASFPSHFKTVGVLLSLLAVGLFAAAGITALPQTAEWVWHAAFAALGILVAVVAAILIGYYAFSSEGRMKRTLFASVAVVAFALSLIRPTMTVLLMGVATAAVLVLFAAGSWLRHKYAHVHGGDSRRTASLLYEARRTPAFWTPFTILLYGAIPVTLLVVYEQDLVLVAALALVIVGSGAILLLILVGGRSAVRLLAQGPLDADEALAYLFEKHGIVETLPDGRRPARTADGWDERTKAICELLLPGGRWPRRWLTARVNELGNADRPPMFKSFVTLEVAGDTLVLRCHGVSGWEEHERDVPVEDCVRIPLRPPPDAASAVAGFPARSA